MTDLPTWLVIVLAIAGILGPVAGVWLGGQMARKTAREERRETQGEDRRRLVSGIIGEAIALAEELNPDSLALNVHPDHTPQRLAELRTRWRQIKGPLYGITVLDMQIYKDVTAFARSFEDALSATAHMVDILLRKQEGAKEFRERALSRRGEALQAGANLAVRMSSVEGSSTGQKRGWLHRFWRAGK